jgi:hypothetical protein
LHGLGDNLVSLVRGGCRLSQRVSEEAILTFKPGQRPQMLVRGPWSASGLICAAWAASGCAVRRHGCECERRYVGMAVPEGGDGGLRWAWWSCWMSGRQPRKLVSVEDIDLVSHG